MSTNRPQRKTLFSLFRSILGVPWFEMGGKVSIDCEKTGYSANIEFLTKVCLFHSEI
jgi:hypothetical protein